MGNNGKKREKKIAVAMVVVKMREQYKKRSRRRTTTGELTSCRGHAPVPESGRSMRRTVWREEVEFFTVFPATAPEDGDDGEKEENIGNATKRRQCRPPPTEEWTSQPDERTAKRKVNLPL